MFSWCAHCQTLIGEVAPFDDYAIVEGTCPSCAWALRANPGHPARGRELFDRLSASAVAGDLAEARRCVDEALAQGWRCSDVAVGLLQPVLYEVGRQWEQCGLPAAQEHVFSHWCGQVLGELGARFGSVAAGRVLICAVDGNHHCLGPQMIGLYLQERGIAARVIVPGLPYGEILELCRRERPQVLGLSVSMAQHLDRARAVIAGAATLPHPPQVVIGGLAARLPAAEGMARAFTAADIDLFLH